MRNRKLSILVVLLLSACIGCQNNSEKVQKASISGSVSPPIEGYVTLTFGGIIDSAKINKEGDFRLDIETTVSGTGMLLFNNRFTNLYLAPEKELILGINTVFFPEETEFAGELGPINNYLKLASKLDQNTAVTQDQLFVLQADRFIHLTDSIRDLKMQLLDEYAKRYPDLDADFIMQHRTDIQYAWATQRILYPGYFALLKKEYADLPDNYHNGYLDEIEINNPDLLISSVFQGFLEDYLDYKQALYLDDHPEVKKLWFPGSVARFRVIQQEFSDSTVADQVLYSSMNDHLDNYGTSHLETFVTNFQFHCKNDNFKKLIADKIDSYEKLDRGEKAPAFTALNKDEELVKLNDFEGKLLYINLWATWSPWSLQEFPYWEALIARMSNTDVEFISISMDFAKDIKNWKYILEDRKLSGTHLIQDPESNIWAEKYFINDLPRYLLIDKEGKIISVHAPRPSENMEEVLTRLLQE